MSKPTRFYYIKLRDRKDDVRIEADRIKRPSAEDNPNEHYKLFIDDKEVASFRQGDVIGWVVSG